MTTRAMIVIDVQNDYFPGGALPLFEAEEVERRLAGALREAKAAGDRIILVRHVFPADSGLLAQGGTGIGIRTAILDAAEGAPVVTKAFADAFQETDLMAHLGGVTDLLICGMMTQNCVAFTAMSRAADSFNVTVLSDLCAAPSEIVHKVALNALGSKLRLLTADNIRAPVA